jgi:hypothetical protein
MCPTTVMAVNEGDACAVTPGRGQAISGRITVCILPTSRITQLTERIWGCGQVVVVAGG